MSMRTLYQIDKRCSSEIGKMFIPSVIYLGDKKMDYRAMMTIADIRRANARALAAQTGTRAAFGEKVGMDSSQVSQIIGKNPVKDIGNAIARRIEIAFGKPKGWMDVEQEPESPHRASKDQDLDPAGHHNHPHRRAADFELVSEQDAPVPTGRIEYWEAKGSCGGGFLNYEVLPKGHLVKEYTFFKKYNLKPENAFAIYADGNSMAEFIVDGDIVIFDKSKTMPRSGHIYCIEHPDGLRIKVLRRGIDGSWLLESKNTDKRLYPDERVPPGQDDLLKIRGEFVYRQGG
jgi:phage repressor protein C with HTH and peptisase S24 domain